MTRDENRAFLFFVIVVMIIVGFYSNGTLCGGIAGLVLGWKKLTGQLTKYLCVSTVVAACTGAFTTGSTLRTIAAVIASGVVFSLGYILGRIDWSLEMEAPPDDKLVMLAEEGAIENFVREKLFPC